MKQTIQGYLVEQTFSEQMQLFAEAHGFNFLGTQVKLEKFRYDCGIDAGSVKYLLEFDGYQHYTDAGGSLQWLAENEAGYREWVSGLPPPLLGSAYHGNAALVASKGVH
jgi:hypothetical protein